MDPGFFFYCHFELVEKSLSVPLSSCFTPASCPCPSTAGCAKSALFAHLRVLQHFWMRNIAPFCTSPRARLMDVHVLRLVILSVAKNLVYRDTNRGSLHSTGLPGLLLDTVMPGSKPGIIEWVLRVNGLGLRYSSGMRTNFSRMSGKILERASRIWSSLKPLRMAMITVSSPATVPITGARGWRSR